MALARAVSPQDFLGIGLEIFGHKRWRFYKNGPNLDRFKEHFGVAPITCHQIWQRLRSSHKNAVKLDPRAKPEHLLLAIVHLWSYQTEGNLASRFSMTSKTARKWRRLYVKKISLLLDETVGTLDDADEGMIMMLSVDGTHCRVEEPRPFSRDNSSHKFGGKPALNYELGILLHRPKLVWVYGPTRPGAKNDLTVFQEALGPALQAMGRVAIGDGIYSSDSNISAKNPEFDSKELNIFKNRALARHEAYNGLLKNFNVLKHAFRHKNNNLLAAHRIHFAAVAVLVQTQVDNGSFSMFDVYYN